MLVRLCADCAIAICIQVMTSFIYPVVVAWTWNYGWLDTIFDVGSADGIYQQKFEGIARLLSLVSRCRAYALVGVAVQELKF